MKPYFVLPFFFQKLIWIPTRLALIIFGSLKVYGLENVREIEKGIRVPVLFAVNHSSEIDPFMVPASLPFWSRFSPLFYVVREKSFYTRNGWRKHLFNNWFIAMWGGYNAPSGLRDYEKSLSKHTEILRDGKSFCVFPEGGITRDGTIQPAKGGISFLAHSTLCVIIPVRISGVYGMSVSDFFLNLFLRKGKQQRKISIFFGKPIKPEELYMNLKGTSSSGESVWKKEADYIMKKVGELGNLS